MKKLIFFLVCILAMSSTILAAEDSDPVNELAQIKKMTPENAILIYTWSNDALPYLADSLRQLLAQNKIGNPISKTMQDNCYEVIQRIDPPQRDQAMNQYLLQCAKAIGGYLLTVRVIIGQGYKVMTEYELIDPGNNLIVCSNSLSHNYGWSLKSFSDTAMLDSSLKKMVKDLAKQLKTKKPGLLKKK